MAHGFDNSVVIAKETTYGTASATSSDYKHVGIIDSFEPEENFNIEPLYTIGSRAPLMVRQGASEVDVTFKLSGVQNARLLAYALGKIVTAGDATNGFTYTITPVGRSEALPSMTAQQNIGAPALVRNFLGGKVDSLKLTAKAEEAVEMDVDVMFQSVSNGVSAQTVTAELTNYFMFYEGTVKINSTTVADVTEFELEVNNNLERRFTLSGANKPNTIEEGSLEVTASLTMDLNSTTYATQFANGTAISVDLVLQDVADPKHSITIALTGGLYDTQKLEASAEDVQEQELEAVFTGITVTAKEKNTTLI
jgi:hypothetical protein